MTDNTTRRDVLKIAGTVTAISGITTTATADQKPDVRVVEAGIRYDAPSNYQYDLVMPDSRPPFTVDKDGGRLLILNTAPDSILSRIRETNELLDEQTAHTGTKVTVGPKDGILTALPIDLSSRMRTTRAISLESAIRTPKIVLNTNSKRPTLSVESTGKIDLEPGKRTQMRLESIVAEARTTKVVGKASLEGVPDYLVGLEREQDTVEIDVTPVVEAINHGELSIEQQNSPPKREQT